MSYLLYSLVSYAIQVNFKRKKNYIYIIKNKRRQLRKYYQNRDKNKSVRNQVKINYALEYRPVLLIIITLFLVVMNRLLQ